MTDFTKKTGDYRSLSATDIRLLALTYQLEKRHVGVDHIKTVPEKKVCAWLTMHYIENWRILYLGSKCVMLCEVLLNCGLVLKVWVSLLYI